MRLNCRFCLRYTFLAGFVGAAIDSNKNIVYADWVPCRTESELGSWTKSSHLRVRVVFWYIVHCRGPEHFNMLLLRFTGQNYVIKFLAHVMSCYKYIHKITRNRMELSKGSILKI